MADKLIDNHLGIVNCGNWYRIKKVMRKAKSGEPITGRLPGRLYYTGLPVLNTGDLLCISGI